MAISQGGQASDRLHRHPALLENDQTKTRIDYQTDISSGSTDHKLLICDFTAKAKPHTKLVKYRAVRHDRALLQDPARASIPRGVLSASPQTPWRAHTNDSLVIWTWYVRQVMEMTCPVRRHRKRQPWISRDTMDLIKIRSHTRQQLEHARETHPDSTHEDLRAELKLARKAVTYAVRSDKKARDTKIAEHLARANQAGDSREVHKLARSLTPYKSRGCSMIALEDGTPASSYQEARFRWFRHFCGSLKATSRSLQQVLADSSTQESRRFTALTAKHNLVKHMAPPRTWLATKHRCKKTGKSTGTDGIPGELYRIASMSSSKAVAPILAKAAWCLSSPLAARGGQLLELWKTKAHS